MIDIYRASAITKSIDIDNNSVHRKDLLQQDVISLSFTLSDYFEFKIEDYINVPDKGLNGQPGNTKYYLFEVPSVERQGVYSYKYTLQFFGKMHRIDRAAFMLDGTSSFFFNGNSDEAMALLKQNLQRVYGSSVNALSAAGVPFNVVKRMDFNNVSCLGALKMIAESFDREFEFFEVDKESVRLVDRLGDQVFGTVYSFKKFGIRSIKAKPINSKNLVTRLYVFGSERNISFGDYGHKRLKLPGTPYVENNKNIYGLKEGTIIFDDVYPRRTGTVTGLIRGATYKIRDGSMDFDLNSYLTASKAKMTFTSGGLSGYEFNILSYDHSIKQFEIQKYVDDQDLSLPNTAIEMAISDTFVIHDIKLPPIYITAAETDLQTKANEAIAEMSAINYEFDIEMDYVFLRKNNTSFDIGDLFRLDKNEFGGTDVVFRIISLTKNMNNEYDYKLSISKKYNYSRIERLARETAANETKIREEEKERRLDKFRAR